MKEEIFDVSRIVAVLAVIYGLSYIFYNEDADKVRNERLATECVKKFKGAFTLDKNNNYAGCIVDPFAQAREESNAHR